jgi:hypothetical protein
MPPRDDRSRDTMAWSSEPCSLVVAVSGLIFQASPDSIGHTHFLQPSKTVCRGVPGLHPAQWRWESHAGDRTPQRR